LVRLRWNFDKIYYSPSESAKINIWGINNGTSLIYISDVAVEFDFGIYDLQETICGAIPAQNEAFLGSVDLKLPPNIVGSSQFNLRCRIYYLEDDRWISGPILTSQKFILNIFLKSIYRVFLSRGIHFEDRIVGDPIAYMIREWGFHPITVGIDIRAPDYALNQIIDSEILNSNGLIAIATPRILDQTTQTYRTLEWLQSEAGLAIPSFYYYH
jgi:hypothetical protein